MRRLIYFALVLLSCNKNNNTPTAAPSFNFRQPYAVPTAAEAAADCDTSLKGVYKGVMINAADDAATFQFNIANGNRRVYGLQFMHGVKRDSLITYQVDTATHLLHYPLVHDSPGINTGARFYTIFESFLPDSANVWVQFGVSPGGINPIINGTLNANQTLNAVLKERRNQQVYCFEGSYVSEAGPDNGPVAFAIGADTMAVLVASKANPQFFPAAGAAFSNNQFAVRVYDGPGGASFILTGNVTGTTCSGTWTRENSTATGTFTAHRTL